MRVERQSKDECVVSAPGKTLVSGGYALLWPGGTGLVLGVDARFFCQGRVTPSEEVKVLNPQLPNCDWDSRLSSSTNIYLDHLNAVMSGFLRKQGLSFSNFTFTIAFDHRFVSPSEELVGHAEFYGQEFRRYAKGLGELRKTGLGSSACVVVVLVAAALLLSRGQAEPELVFWLSFWTVRLAQSKTASGFDVSAAVFATQLFRSIPEWLAQEKFDAIKRGSLAELLAPVDCFVERLSFSSLHLWMCDIGKSTSTPVAAKKVTQCLRKAGTFRRWVVEGLNAVTSQLVHLLARPHPDTIHALNRRHRALQRLLGSVAGVEIEPAELRAMLDSAEALYAVCPGAGGHDAVAFLTSSGKPPKINSSGLRFSLFSCSLEGIV